MAQIAYLTPACDPAERRAFNRLRRLAILLLVGSVGGFWSAVGWLVWG